jgi:26S proteasome non-ATPase regulatory subunit 9
MGLQLIPKETAHARIQTLMTQRSTIEASIASQSTILTTNGVTMETPLVDREGFPRADIDVYNVRLARVRIIELRNDLRGVMDEIGQLLEVVYKPGGDGSSSSDAAAGKSTSGAPEKEELKPFAKVDGVAPSSPAAEAVGGHDCHLHTS